MKRRQSLSWRLTCGSLILLQNGAALYYIIIISCSSSSIAIMNVYIAYIRVFLTA
jgi:hypothetical protein